MLIVILIALLAFGIALALIFPYQEWPIPICILAGIVSVVGLLMWPMSYFNSVDEVQQFKSVQRTTSNQRINEPGLEGAAYRNKIAESNAWLASAKYWNATILDPYITDEVDELEFIE